MTPAFADTYYYVALANPKDAGHRKALAYARTATAPMITTAWVITELADALCKANNRPTFARILTLIRNHKATTVVPATQSLMDRGLQLYESRPDKDWSLTDCISFTVMADRGLTDALTADHHFEQAGFVALLT